jgi:hypothetical protein
MGNRFLTIIIFIKLKLTDIGMMMIRGRMEEGWKIPAINAVSILPNKWVNFFDLL